MKGVALFITRPVLTILSSLSVLLLGLLGFSLMPVSPLPQIDFPVIMVRASLSGASPETMSSSVAAPLERALGKISGVNELTSTSSQGSTRIIMQFDMDRDVDSAARDVQAALNAAQSLLPSGMTSRPSYQKMNPSGAPIMMLALTSDIMTQPQLYDLVNSVLQPKMAQVNGVGGTSIYGGAAPGIRVDIEPLLLEQQGIALTTVKSAINNALPDKPVGVLQGDERQWWISTNAQQVDAVKLRDVIVAWHDGAAVRLGDVAHVYDGGETLYSNGYYNGRPAVIIGASRAAGANIIETVEHLKALTPQLKALMPEGVQIHTVLDRSGGVQESLRATEEALLASIALVVFIVYLFLRNWRAVFIPACTLPLSLVGTCAITYLLGYSLDNLSLMAMIIATGFVVDDAIVVLENVIRHREMGKGRLQAAIEGAREIGFTVMAMTLSLIAVFLPILLNSDMIGKLFREFAMTLCIALIISLLVSLTLTPMLCARLLKDPDHSKPLYTRQRTLARLHDMVVRLGQGMTHGYMRSLDWALKHRRLVLCGFLGTIVLMGYFVTRVEKEFFPSQDTGVLMGRLRADQATSSQALIPIVNQFNEEVRKDPSIEHVVSSTGSGGFGSRNTASYIIQLKPISERDATADQVVQRLTARLSKLKPGVEFNLRSMQDLMSGGRSANAAYQFTLQSDDLALLREWTPKVDAALRKLPSLTGFENDSTARGREVRLIVDRTQAERYGVNMADIDDFLGNAFGQTQVATRHEVMNEYHVIMGLAPAWTAEPEVLDMLSVINDDGQRIPLSAFAHIETGSAATSVDHEDQMATMVIAFNLVPGVTLNDVQDDIQQTMTKIGLPDKIKSGFGGSQKMFQQSSSALPLLLVAALLTMYIVLGVLYESLVHPLTILSTLPSAGLGALLLIDITGTRLSLISFIGILLLMGIVKKNAIMLVDFALAHRRQQHISEERAITEACRQRLRPIMMTSLAAFCGALPLMLESGGSADLRRPLGIAIAGGLVVSQLLTLYTTPVIYLYMARFEQWLLRLWLHIRPTQ
ncbi:efflux RND transporter permease subunit [Zymobacter palmae]|uniref:Probable drug efflux pump transmembrane protein n=1 Tax=Zymobacter palmae TaxID=33074 RepID=A0A348HH39_9GAMM|nr:efflux RND transporter permease subunit [Zymobacter palmae]BBG30941.1 probable drug efflux pump transmembrane protein [Zymobacter palmae]